MSNMITTDTVTLGQRIEVNGKYYTAIRGDCGGCPFRGTSNCDRILVCNTEGNIPIFVTWRLVQ